MYEFTKYPSITLANKEKEVEYFIKNGYTVGEFEVTEKLDGSNYSYWYDGSELKYAKRTSFIGEDKEDFYEHKSVDVIMVPKIKQLYSYLFGNSSKEDVLTVYGELYGGGIKSMVKYGDIDKAFACFDIMVNGEFLPTYVVEKLCTLFDILHVPVIKRSCSFEEAMAIHNLFTQAYGLAGVSDRESEGVVIKPVKPKWLATGKRLILKNKNEQFLESKVGKKEKKPIEPMGEEDLKIFTQLSTYVNEARVYSAVSKIGEITPKCFPKLMSAVIGDVMEEFAEDGGTDLLSTRPKASKKRIQSELQKMVSMAVRPVFLELISDK